MRLASPYPLLVVAVLCISLGSILVRLAQVPPLMAAFDRVFAEVPGPATLAGGAVVVVALALVTRYTS